MLQRFVHLFFWLISLATFAFIVLHYHTDHLGCGFVVLTWFVCGSVLAARLLDPLYESWG